MQFRFVSIEPDKHGPVVCIHWRRLGLVLLVAATASWPVMTFGAWLFVKYHRGIPDVRYSDLLLPHRWPAYRISEGNHYIARGEELLQRGEAMAALPFLRTGITKAPTNARGRTLLAGLYVAGRRPDLARDLLLDGLHHQSDNAAYLQATLSFLLEFQEDTKLIEVAGQLLATVAARANHPMVATYAATAAYYRGNYDQAEDLLIRYHLGDSGDGAVLLARIDWARGYPELALLRLNELLDRQPGHDGARALLAAYCRELGRTGEQESAVVGRLAGDPLSPAPRIGYLHLLHQRGDRARLEHDAEAYLSQFQRDSSALLQLADFAANTGRPDLARRVQRILSDRHEDNGAPALMVAEAHIAAGEYQAALALISGYARDHPEWAARLGPVFSGLQAVALCGLGRMDEARLQLESLLARENLRADNLVAVSNRLAALGAHNLARSALSRAVETDPLNQAALAGLLRLELDDGNVTALSGHLDRFLHTRQPSREILSRAYPMLGSDSHLFLPGQARLLALLRTALAPSRP